MFLIDYVSKDICLFLTCKFILKFFCFYYMDFKELEQLSQIFNEGMKKAQEDFHSNINLIKDPKQKTLFQDMYKCALEGDMKGIKNIMSKVNAKNN